MTQPQPTEEKAMKATKATIYETMTHQIVQAIEEGAATYRMPWHRISADITCPINAASGRCYRGLNVITLWMTLASMMILGLVQEGMMKSGVWSKPGTFSARRVLWKLTPYRDRTSSIALSSASPTSSLTLSRCAAKGRPRNLS
jgi:hypothetical protein